MGSAEGSGFVGYDLFGSGKIGNAVFNDFILDANRAISLSVAGFCSASHQNIFLVTIGKVFSESLQLG